MRCIVRNLGKIQIDFSVFSTPKFIILFLFKDMLSPSIYTVGRNLVPFYESNYQCNSRLCDGVWLLCNDEIILLSQSTPRL